jgi:hypothetical protein
VNGLPPDNSCFSKSSCRLSEKKSGNNLGLLGNPEAIIPGVVYKITASDTPSVCKDRAIIRKLTMSHTQLVKRVSKK